MRAGARARVCVMYISCSYYNIAFQVSVYTYTFMFNYNIYIYYTCSNCYTATTRRAPTHVNIIYPLQPHRHHKCRSPRHHTLRESPLSVRACMCILSGNLNNGRMSAWRAESVFYIRMAQLEIFRRRGDNGAWDVQHTYIYYYSRGYVQNVCVCVLNVSVLTWKGVLKPF